MQQIRNSANSKAHCDLHHGACAQKILSTFCMQDISYFSQNLLNILFYSETVTNIFSVYAISKIHFFLNYILYSGILELGNCSDLPDLFTNLADFSGNFCGITALKTWRILSSLHIRPYLWYPLGTSELQLDNDLDKKWPFIKKNLLCHVSYLINL